MTITTTTIHPLTDDEMNAPLHHTGRVTILVGDVRERLRDLPDNSFDCIVTSPPYWGLRDYGVAGQIGLEPTLTEYLDTMVAVCRELRRVLKPSGTFWLNVGDSYAATTKGSGGTEKGTIARGAGQSTNAGAFFATRKLNIGDRKPKDLCLVPNRLAIRLQEDGWWVRSEIIWSKPNPMPESVTDRPTSAHEKIWLLTKSERYAYDLEAIREPISPHNDGRGINVPELDGYRGDRARNGPVQATRQYAEIKGANCRNVWTIATQPYSEAHFATFPPELAERCIKAGCPAGGHVLDPFGGAGTTALVAHRLHRSCTLIELNSAYVEIARNRLADDGGMFASVSVDLAGCRMTSRKDRKCQRN